MKGLISILLVLLFSSVTAGADGPPPPNDIVIPPPTQRVPATTVTVGYASLWVLGSTGLEDSVNANGISVAVEHNLPWDTSVELDAAVGFADVASISRRTPSKYHGGCAATDCERKRRRRGFDVNNRDLTVVTSSLTARWNALPMLFGRTALMRRLEANLEAGPALVHQSGPAVDNYTSFAGAFGLDASYRITEMVGVGIEANYFLAQKRNNVAQVVAGVNVSF